jgi:hypothetical protein
VSQTSLINRFLHELPCGFNFNHTQLYLAPSSTATINILFTQSRLPTEKANKQTISIT